MASQAINTCSVGGCFQHGRGVQYPMKQLKSQGSKRQLKILSKEALYAFCTSENQAGWLPSTQQRGETGDGAWEVRARVPEGNDVALNWERGYGTGEEGVVALRLCR